MTAFKAIAVILATQSLVYNNEFHGAQKNNDSHAIIILS